jgi:hypothetical protein
MIVPDVSGNSGIEGQVLIGPVCPAYKDDETCENEPYQATISVLDKSEQLIKRFNTNEEGFFQVNLEPGTYILRPESPGQLPRADKQVITVIQGEYLTVNITYDSGIR